VAWELGTDDAGTKAGMLGGEGAGDAPWREVGSGSGRTWLMGWSGRRLSSSESSCLSASSLLGSLLGSGRLRVSARAGSGGLADASSASVEAAMLSPLLSSASVLLVLDVPVGQLRRVSRATFMQNIAAEASAAAAMSVVSCAAAVCESCPSSSNGTVWSNATRDPATGQYYVPARATPTVRLRVRIVFLPLGAVACQLQGEVWPPQDWLVDARSRDIDPVAFAGPGSNMSWAVKGRAYASAGQVRDTYFATHSLTARSSPALRAASLAAVVSDESSHRVIGSWLVWASGSANAGAVVDVRLRCATDAMEGSVRSWWESGDCGRLVDTEETVGWCVAAAGMVVLSVLGVIESWLCLRCRAGAKADKLQGLAASAAMRDRRAAISLLGSAGRGVQATGVVGLALSLGRLSAMGLFVSVVVLGVHAVCAGASALRAIVRTKPREWDECTEGGSTGEGPGESSSRHRVLERRWLGGMGALGQAGVAAGCLMDADTALAAACPLSVSRVSSRRYRQLASVPSLGVPLPGAALDVGRAPTTWRVWMGLDDADSGDEVGEDEDSGDDAWENGGPTWRAAVIDERRLATHDRRGGVEGRPGQHEIDQNGAIGVIQVGLPIGTEDEDSCDSRGGSAGSAYTTSGGEIAGMTAAGVAGGSSMQEPAVAARSAAAMGAASASSRASGVWRGVAASAIMPLGGASAAIHHVDDTSLARAGVGRAAASQRRPRCCPCCQNLWCQTFAPGVGSWILRLASVCLPEVATLSVCGLVLWVVLSGPQTMDAVGAEVAKRLLTMAGLRRSQSLEAASVMVSVWLRPQVWSACGGAMLVSMGGVLLRGLHVCLMSRACAAGRRDGGRSDEVAPRPGRRG